MACTYLVQRSLDASPRKAPQEISTQAWLQSQGALSNGAPTGVSVSSPVSRSEALAAQRRRSLRIRTLSGAEIHRPAGISRSAGHTRNSNRLDGLSHQPGVSRGILIHGLALQLDLISMRTSEFRGLQPLLLPVDAPPNDEEPLFFLRGSRRPTMGSWVSAMRSPPGKSSQALSPQSLQHPRDRPAIWGARLLDSWLTQDGG